MELSSARALKSMLAADVVEPLAKAAVTARALNVSARRMETVDSKTAVLRSLALGIAPRGPKNFRLAIRLQRRELESSDHVNRIRERAKGEVDVAYVGRIRKRMAPWYQEYCRPLRIGCSIGHYQITAGTLGCFVRTRASGEALILSNNHVLADENRAQLGDPVIQAGRYDGGNVPDDVVGELRKFVKLSPDATNVVDCAVASVREGIQCDRDRLEDIGMLSGLGSDVLAAAGEPVAKAGRTTGTTRGRVSAFELDNVVVGYDIGSIRFDNQIEIEGAGGAAFSDGGDSGSLIVDGDCKGVALLFAGSDQGGDNGMGLTYANPLHEVLRQLDVELLY